jgi:uncharacterized protein YxeA
MKKIMIMVLILVLVALAGLTAKAQEVAYTDRVEFFAVIPAETIAEQTNQKPSGWWTRTGCRTLISPQSGTKFS